MQISIRLFAGLAEAIGSQILDFHVAEPQVTAGKLKELLSASYPEAAGQITVSMVAIDREYAPEDTVISNSSEVALIPPVSGGEPSPDEGSTQNGLYTVTEQPLRTEDILDKVLDKDHGASLVFVGTTREMTGDERTEALHYEAYVPMALSKFEEIGREVMERWQARCAISHRIGHVGLKEASVIIAVSTPHRDTCYEASRFAIEELKRMVPIWKKDIGASSEKWKGADKAYRDN
ncbi:molybdopterin synthase catalytic subunit [Paenibacillus sophorae]|uniref:Molybdenum cofactor biosynthesis protein MoaE n=1 Tax=Paenibacillus sophorae TaxID=1333845 RepID=A0A1H8MHP5_9BACL|nr:molybdenum cofactor biosynthesis protein MoaE [Paenibacillus sophorae]QWU17817.1 molybdenum cofactor biosynthesis protein MoaE [Paenibacillus sophorae]SEO16857.1 molybdopterin synthase catalytic subunit [Paenibacillus sophorae]